MKRKKLLIVAPYQFGELSDCYYWAKYATKEGWNVSYLGYRYKERRIKERSCTGVNVIGVKHRDIRYLHGILFIIRIIAEIILHRHNNILICYFPYCEIIAKLFYGRNVVLDIRTLSVSENEEERNAFDENLKKISKSFKTVSVISQGVGAKIGKDYKLLPLGAEILSGVSKRFDNIRMFYIGTFNNRNLDIFIEGLALYQHRTGNNCSLDIVGGGFCEEEEKVKKAIINYNAKNVNLHGYLAHDEAMSFFDKCNVGVCYVPMTDYYDFQPPTKLYEYLLSGMACIATKTNANCEVMNDSLGVLVDDNAEDVSRGLSRMFAIFSFYDSASIRNSVCSYHWNEIVNHFLLPLFE